MEQIKDTINKSLNDNSKPWSKGFEYIEKKTNLPRMTVFLGGAAFCAIYLVFGYGAELLCNLIGVAYPAYVSIHAIETSKKEDDTKWLIYWVTFAMLSLAEYFSNFLIWLIPLYWLVKCTFLVWCMAPIKNNGSEVIYGRLIRPYFIKHHKAADKFIADVKKSVESVVANSTNSSKDD